MKLPILINLSINKWSLLQSMNFDKPRENNKI